MWLLSNKNDHHKTRLSIIFRHVRDLRVSDVMWIDNIRAQEMTNGWAKYEFDGYPVSYQPSAGEFVRRQGEASGPLFVVAYKWEVIEDDLLHYDALSAFDAY